MKSVQTLESQIGILQRELRNLWEEMDQTAEENVKLKNHLRVLKRQKDLSLPQKQENKAKSLPPVQLEKSFFAAGDAFLDKKEYDQAIAQFTEAIKLNSGNASAYFKRGIAYKGRGSSGGNREDYDNAIRDYYQATFLKGNDIKLFRSREADYENNGRRHLSVSDYKRLFKLHPIFNDAHDELKKAKKERRGEVLKLTLKWAALLLAFSGLYISAYKWSRPLASNTAVFLRRNFYDGGQAGEEMAVAALIAFGLALTGFFVVGSAVFLKKALRSSLSERAVFTSFGGIGCLFSAYLIYSFFSMPNYYQVANDCYEKKDYACAVENYTAAINWSPKYWLTGENEAYNGRANTYLKMGDIELAVKDYDKAVQLNPNDAKAAENLKTVNNSRQKKTYKR
jgi:tetratricopeptide (TPR) repeat protein